MLSNLAARIVGTYILLMTYVWCSIVCKVGRLVILIEVNFAAHRLAKTIIQQVIDQIWMEEISNYIRDLLLLEQLALSL
jgi:hypothetical protein